MVFRDEVGRWMMFHQAWHKHTLYETLAEAITNMEAKGFVFASVERPAAITANLLRLCRSIANIREPIPFAFGFDSEASWNEVTLKLNMPKGAGLTCVNFAIVLFKQGSVSLIDWADWPLREEDKQFQEATLAALTASCLRRSPGGVMKQEYTDHLAAVKKEIESDSGCARVRPEELVGAVLSGRHKPTHLDAIPAGVIVTRLVDAFASASGH